MSETIERKGAITFKWLGNAKQGLTNPVIIDGKEVWALNDGRILSVAEFKQLKKSDEIDTSRDLFEIKKTNLGYKTFMPNDPLYHLAELFKKNMLVTNKDSKGKELNENKIANPLATAICEVIDLQRENKDFLTIHKNRNALYNYIYSLTDSELLVVKYLVNILEENLPISDVKVRIFKKIEENTDLVFNLLSKRLDDLEFDSLLNKCMSLRLINIEDGVYKFKDFVIGSSYDSVKERLRSEPKIKESLFNEIRILDDTFVDSSGNISIKQFNEQVEFVDENMEEKGTEFGNETEPKNNRGGRPRK